MSDAVDDQARKPALAQWDFLRAGRASVAARSSASVTGAAHGVSATRVTVATRDQLAACPRWTRAFASQYKDHRFYELLEDTVAQFEYRYLLLRDAKGDVCSIQPFFIVDQDLVAGIPGVGHIAGLMRRLWPRFMRLRTMMVGCAAGEGHVDAGDDRSHAMIASLLQTRLTDVARSENAQLVVLKEFPAAYRSVLTCLTNDGYLRVPSLPASRLDIGYADFEDYMRRALTRMTRKDLRRKFKTAARAAPIEMSVLTDASAIVDELYPLYLQVYDRSKLRFEKLTKEFLCEIGRRMPDRARFFVWRQNGRVIAFNLCLLHGDTISDEYIGLDYSVALDLHLYHYTFRDIVSWAIAHGVRTYRSNGLNYEPKLHLRQRLAPLDLYVRHTSRVANVVLHYVLPWLEPTRYDRTLKLFANYDELWGRR